MNIQFDHIVIFVADLDVAVQDFRAQGFHTVYGGSHAMWGTYNALIYIGRCYIELIAIEREEVFTSAAKEPFTLHETYAQRGRHNGLTRMALRTNASAKVASTLAAAGFEVHGPSPFSRQTKTGEIVGWELVHIGVGERNVTLPFIIDWDTPDAERFAKLQEQNVMATHPAGDLVLSSIYLYDGDLKQLATYYKSLGIPYTLDTEELHIVLGNVNIIYHTQVDEQAKIVLNNAREPKQFTYENTVFLLEK